MSSTRDQVIAEFLEIFLEDDQLWAAGGAAEIQALLQQNVDDRGRLNGKVLLNFLVTRGVTSIAARAAMERFANKRRASMAAAKNQAAPQGGAPRASGGFSTARASGAARANSTSTSISVRPHASSIGVTRVRPDMASEPPAPGPPSAAAAKTTLPSSTAREADVESTQVRNTHSEDTTLMSDAFSEEHPPSRPRAAADISAPGRAAPTSIRGGVPRAQMGSLDPAVTQDPPPLQLDPSALTAITKSPDLSTEISQPSPMALDPSALTEISNAPATTPSGESRKRSASEIRGAPVAASASASGPSHRAPGPPSAASGPPSALSSGPPSAFVGAGGGVSARSDKRAQRQVKQASKNVLSGDMADALGITARKEAAAETARQEAIKQDHTLGRVARNPENEKGPVHPGIFIAAAGGILMALGIAWFVTKPVPPVATFVANDQGLPCSEPTSWQKELVCRIPRVQLEAPAGELQKRLSLTRTDAEKAGYRGIWFIIDETDQLWAPPRNLWNSTAPGTAVPPAAAAGPASAHKSATPQAEEGENIPAERAAASADARAEQVRAKAPAERNANSARAATTKAPSKKRRGKQKRRRRTRR